MDVLKAEIESKRKASHISSSTDSRPIKKYMRKGDLEKAKAEAERVEEERQRLAKLELEATRKKSGQHLVASGSKKDGPHTPLSGEVTPHLGEIETDEAPELFNVSNEEAVRRLRSRGQPIRLFGESDKERRLRLRALQLIEERTEGGRNELMRALEGVEGNMDLEELAKRARDAKGAGDSSITKRRTDGLEDEMDGELKTGEDAEVTVDLELIKTDPRKIYPQIYFALKVLFFFSRWGQISSLIIAHPTGRFLCVCSVHSVF